MIDLGCGSSPHRKATVAVDKYIEPIHRKYGANQKIDVAKIEEQGIKFVEADFEDLPFEDKSFDVAYSHHVVEHLDNPAKACKEMQRVAKGGGDYVSINLCRVYFWTQISQMACHI